MSNKTYDTLKWLAQVLLPAENGQWILNSAD